MSVRGERRFTGVPILVLAPLAVFTAGLLQVLPVLKGRRRSAAEVVGCLDRRISGDGDQREWEEFTSVRIRDAGLEAIRRDARLVPLALNPEGLQTLRHLRDRAAAAAERRDLDAAENVHPCEAAERKPASREA